MAKQSSFGVCQACGARKGKAAMFAHVQDCMPRQVGAGSSRVPEPTLLLRAEARGLPTFWLTHERVLHRDTSQGQHEHQLNHQHLTVQDADAVAAVEQFRRRPAVGFSDCLMVEVTRKAGHGPLGTFDRDLGKFNGAHRL